MPTLNKSIAITVNSDFSADMQAFANSANNIENVLPSGVTMRYGLNVVPSAVLDLTPQDIDLLCNIEKWRRTPVRIRVESKHGCMTFRGLIDGTSVSQAVGDMRMQLVVKSPFQLLAEINPKLLGYHSAGVEFTRLVNALDMERGISNAVGLSISIGAAIQADLKKPFFDGLIEVLKAVVNSQIQWQYTQAKASQQNEVQAAIEAAEAIREKHLKMAILLLDKIDTSFVKTDLTLTDYMALGDVLNSICETRGNLLDVLLAVIDSVGCGLVIGNEKAFIVPNSGFFKQSHESTIEHRALSTKPNIVYPAQYSSVSLNDNGYRDIAGVYVMSDDNNILAVDGFYHDKDHGGSGGVIGETMPYIIGFNSAAQLAAATPEAHKSAGDSSQPNTSPAPGATGGETEQKTAVEEQSKSEQERQEENSKKANEEHQKVFDKLKTFANQWAQLRYCQLKYTDRLGHVGMPFNPAFSPGAVGSVYMRAPGVYIDFFATEVIHDIRKAVPDSGSATTNVHFNCGRMGEVKSALLSAGLERLDLFDGFDAAKSAKVAEAFVKDIA